MSTDGRCIHELIIDQCALCRPSVRSVPYADEWWLRRQAGSYSASRAFPAQYETMCPGCGSLIEQGDMIRMYEGAAHHEECITD